MGVLGMKAIPTISAEDTMATLDENARGLVDTAMVGARESFDKDWEVNSFLLVIPEQGELKVYPMLHSNDEEKAERWEFMRKQRANNPHVVLISEVWMAMCKKDDMNPDGSVKVMPRNHPNKVEKVMVNLWSGERSVIFAADITRNPNHLGEWRTWYDSSFHKKGFEWGGELERGERYKTNAN